MASAIVRPQRRRALPLVKSEHEERTVKVEQESENVKDTIAFQPSEAHLEKFRRHSFVDLKVSVLRFLFARRDYVHFSIWFFDFVL